MKLLLIILSIYLFLFSYGSCQVATETQRADAVRDAVKHLWTGYKNSSWGSDEVRPIAGGPGGDWGDVGMAILDTLDTLWIAGLRDEFLDGEHWVSNLKFDKLDHAERTSFFEMTIRGLGGLLAAYSLSGHAIFLEKAKELGNRLLVGFPKDGFSLRRQNQRWPVSYIDVHNPSDVEVTPSFHSEFTALADAGSNILEFDFLSQITSDPRYKVAAETTMNNIIEISKKRHQFLAPRTLQPYVLDFESNRVSAGGMADSYFEYLLKRYIQSGRRDTQLLKAWKAAMREMRQALIRTSLDGLTYVAVDANSESDGDGRPPRFWDPTPEMEHLACFVGGMLALGSHVVPADEVEDWWLPTGIDITRTCYEMYRKTASGLAPERVRFSYGSMTPASSEYRLRPETLESLFYLYRITGNETYREWSWNIFQAINRHTRTKYGFAKVSDVSRLPVELEDSEETFMGAETLKYALLVHLPSSVPLDDFVLNTEAHVFPIERQAFTPKSVSSSTRQAKAALRK